MSYRTFATAVLVLTAVLSFDEAIACVTCNKPLQRAIFDGSFFTNLLKLTAPFPVLALGVYAFAAVYGRPVHTEVNATQHAALPATAKPLIVASTVLGIGLGAFVDGILFHQILQWHQMLSNVLPPVTVEAKNVNMFWDGIFHAVSWLITLTGVILLWRAMRRDDAVKSSRVLAGGMLLGWGLFNLVEGTLDHHLLMLHNVNENMANPAVANYAFLGFAVLVIATGWWMIRRGMSEK